MFLSDKQLKKMMKRSYKGAGLKVGRTLTGISGKVDEDVYVIAGAGWTANIMKDFLPATVKGYIVELCGDLPDEEVLWALKEKELIQMAIWDDDLKLEETPLPVDTGEAVRITNVELVSGDLSTRLLQDESRKIYAIEAMKLAATLGDPMIDRGEAMPAGPTPTGGRFLEWQNNCCIYRVREKFLSEEETDFVKKLEGTVLP